MGTFASYAYDRGTALRENGSARLIKSGGREPLVILEGGEKAGY